MKTNIRRNSFVAFATVLNVSFLSLAQSNEGDMTPQDIQEQANDQEENQEGGQTSAFEKPNILWIVTDDHRADALQCFNRATRQEDESPLGYVSSPQLDSLAAEGVLFTRAYCNSPASAPSRASMHSGLYPHHRGVYGFEYHHIYPDFTKPTIAEYLSKDGYNTVAFGKLGTYTRFEDLEKKRRNAKEDGSEIFADIFTMFDEYISTKEHHAKGKSDWAPEVIFSKDDESADAGRKYRFNYPDGSSSDYYYNRKNVDLSEEDHAKREDFYAKNDIIVSSKAIGAKPTPSKVPNMILAGESTMPADRTTDGYLMREFVDYLESANSSDSMYMSSVGREIPKLNALQPQMFYIGHHFPHTPVLPSASFRASFKDKIYKIPEFDMEEFAKMPQQMKVWQSKSTIFEMDEEQKQQIIRDYYAFCAMGDSLLGESVRKFKEFSKKNNKDYLILITVGDHGWHLGEQGVCAKFTGYRQSNETALIAISSKEGVFPRGGVVSDIVEYVDILPTLLSAAGKNMQDSQFDYLDGYSLQDVVARKVEAREYTIGELNHVCGPHAHIRTKDFMFGMRNRKQIPARNSALDANEEMRWALDAPLEEVDAMLYDLRVDSLERNNVALDGEYRELAEFLRKKLATIILGDGRIEVDWSKRNSYKRSTFGLGADDKKLNIPAEIIPIR